MLAIKSKRPKILILVNNYRTQRLQKGRTCGKHLNLWELTTEGQLGPWMLSASTPIPHSAMGTLLTEARSG